MEISRLLRRLGLRRQSDPLPHETKTTPYVYEPLEPLKREIRLVRLPPRRQRLESTSLHLIKTSLDVDIEFTALSYVWGDPSDTSAVMVDGHLFPVTKNLFAALEQLRDEQHETTMWIDALCIQQSDNKEKAWQVQLMGEIYAKATKTIVWLGSDMDMGGIAMQGFAQSAELVSSLDTDDFLRHLQQQDLADVALQSTQFGPSQVELKKLLNREYWFRTWCLQEFCISENLLLAYGEYQVDAGVFQKLTDIFLQSLAQCWYDAASTHDLLTAQGMNPAAFTTENIAGTVHGATRMFQQREQFRRQLHDPKSHGTQSLSDLLIHAFTKQSADVTLHATDPRDRIFGLLNLASDVKELGIYPDYEKSCERVFIQAWSAILAKGQADLLKYAQYGRPQAETTDAAIARPSNGARDPFVLDPYGQPSARTVCKDGEELPSWVPDWRITRDASPGDDLVNKNFAACGNKTATDWIPTGNSNTIALTGVKVDILEEVGAALTPKWVSVDSSFSHVSAFVREIKSFVEKSCLAHPKAPIYDSVAAAEAVWRIPVGDREIASRHQFHYIRATAASAERSESLFNVIEAYDQAMASDDRVSATWTWATTVQQNMGRFDLYYPAIMGYGGWKPFLSPQGFVGLGPAATEVGDVLAIFYGAKVPFVLRPQSGGQYQLLGEAYVHGIMDGEFMQAQRDEVAFHIY
ncbi:hypothetical protein NM208_g3857 [Fusarium decemcellulare]|uniref:Uncharacterized protein n=1 Tax=Fusarium decemcellulare TaxID=57161 RepID=A0ACC1SMM3_9HYPO|nr:hypothetical protein NM208_g3857 [Fusarium decemcellulare]